MEVYNNESSDEHAEQHNTQCGTNPNNLEFSEPVVVIMGSEIRSIPLKKSKLWTALQGFEFDFRRMSEAGGLKRITHHDKRLHLAS